MNYRITFRQDTRDGPVWLRTKPIPEQAARKLARQIEAKTGYPADMEPADRPDLTTRLDQITQIR